LPYFKLLIVTLNKLSLVCYNVYYIGRHSTENVNDGYIGSGTWPRSIKDQTTLTREVLEYATDSTALKLLEGKYLAEHYGKPGCMNLIADPVGFDSTNNPIRGAPCCS
jgi:hypothetical protein